MDAQSESCEPPPCDPQPPGKIRKALKLFGKRKPGSSVASIFSIRGKGDGGPKSPPSMSKTLDGLNEPTAPEAEAEPVDLDQEDESQQDDAPMEEFTGGNMNSETTPTRHSISSLTSAKSLSFLNMLRKGRRGLMGERQTQTESQRPGRQRKGLKGLFGTVRWHGKEKKDDEEEGEPGPPLLASRSNSVEIIKESLTLTPGPPPRSVEGTEEKLPTPQEGPTSSEDSAKVSGSTKPPANERLSTLLGDISSILSFDSLTACGDIVADVEAEWVKASSRMEGAPRTLKVDNSEKTSSSSTSTRSKSSPSPTLSPTTSFKPSPTLATKPTPSPTTTKPIPSPLTKPTVTSTSSPVTKMSPSMLTDPIIPTLMSSPLAKPTPTPSAITQPTPTPTPIPIPQATATATTTPIIQPTPTATSVSITQPTPSPISSTTTKSTTSPAKPTLSPKPSPEIKPDTISSSTTAPMIKPIPSSTPIPPSISAPTSETPPSPTISSTPELAAVTKTEPAPTPVTKPTQAPIPATKPTPSITHESKHTMSTSATKYTPYPPLFGKPTPAPAPTPRPKFVTTFGLSTSRNTAPIAKLEIKQPTGQTSKSSTQTGTTSVRKASISEPTVPIAKSPSAVTPILTSSSATTKSPTVTSAPQVPVLKSPPGIAPSFISSKRVDDDARIDLREDLVRQEGIDNRDSVATQSISKAVKRGPAAKPTTLSKIPVSGGGRPPKLPHRDSQPNGDEDHSNLPTPVHEEETPFTLSRESSSKEALSDVSTESGAVTPTLSHSQDDILDGKLGLQTSSGPAAGATSLTRESKIPIKHGSTAAYHSVQGRAEATRSKIPVSKMPVRRTSNKPAPTATAAATRK
ncbi:APC membrane recruitment protein 2-like [Sinocyclocheilus grahami]|uniref:APC membrane recruitment protein 2-like n=1 Tax=Sinocyclocheilus grahami TaxID=75366 RepID=UPI0007ACAAA9|nr:PREDICTED: APC membrane recruitment protein 2-like [Sinocyclocheilus grahami]